jgi:hypothetical protein
MTEKKNGKRRKERRGTQYKIRMDERERGDSIGGKRERRRVT